jgi:peptidoglycan/xylan/chitin deacetylase (PgdA/CDA1 family)
MKYYFTKTPNLVKKVLKNWVWSFSSKEKILYLTFDDGPTPKITDWVLNKLEQYNAKATFFCVGENLTKYPEISKKITANLHTIGNHTNNHLNGFKTNTSTYLNNLQFSNSTQTSKLFRPPYGKIKFSQAKKIRQKGYKIIMWDVLSADFDNTITPQECLRNVIENASNGSIVVFHDSVKANEKLQFVLPKILEYYSKKGYSFKAIN